MDKKEQRQEIRNRLKTLKDKDYLDEQIYNNLVLLNILKGNVLVYNSINGEVSTKKIVENFKNKVSIYMPKVIGDDMVFVKIDDNTSFKEGAFSILEPVGKEYTKDEISFDVCITPLLGYDENLNRLGKGKGYYDRYARESFRQIYAV